jgi:predicted flap endonuclease-1-like 5' DNA nuclease
VWNNSAFILKQIRGIGQQKAKVLAESNIVNFKQIRECDPGKLEMVIFYQ